MSMFSVFDVAGSGMVAQTMRLNVTASNLANAESVGSSPNDVYRAKNPIFSAVHRDRFSLQDTANIKVRMVGILEDQSPARQRHEPGHPLANEDGYVFASNVNAVQEMVNMLSASRSFQNNVEVMNTAKELLLRTLSIGQ